MSNAAKPAKPARLAAHARGTTADSAMLILSAAASYGRSGWLMLSGERLLLADGEIVEATPGMAERLRSTDGLACWAWRALPGAPEGSREPISLIGFLLGDFQVG